MSSDSLSPGLRVAFVGEPLRLSGHDEFLLEVHSSSGLWNHSWRIQRRWSAVQALHDSLQTQVALPMFPKVSRASRLLRSRDDFLMERGQKIEVYLNTVLAIPGICRCGRLHNFLEVPTHPHEPPTPSVDSEPIRGSNSQMGGAAITVTVTTSGGCDSCRRLCDAVCGIFKVSSGVRDQARPDSRELDSVIPRPEGSSVTSGIYAASIAESNSSIVPGSTSSSVVGPSSSLRDLHKVPGSTSSSVGGISSSLQDLPEVPSYNGSFSGMSEEDCERRNELQRSFQRANEARHRLESMKRGSRGRSHVNSSLGEELLPAELRPGETLTPNKD